MNDVKLRIREFVVENFLFGDDSGLEDETSFLDEGIIDSTGILEMVTFIEETFNVLVKDKELIPENLDSLNNIKTYLERKISKAA